MLLNLVNYLAATGHPVPANASTLITDSASKACADACDTALSLPGIIGSITTALVYIIGALSVLMIIVGGLRYVISGGDPKKTADAKNTITYAIVGVIVAIVSFAIIKFVVTAVATPVPLATPTAKAVPKTK